MTTRRSHSVLLALAVAGSLITGCGKQDSGGNRSPVFNTGVGAAVIEPGGGLPSMPPPGVSPPGGHQGASSSSGSYGQGGPGNYSRSSRGGGQHTAPSSNQSQGGARILSPGANPGSPPPGTPGNAGMPAPRGGGGGGMVSIGGATTIDTRRQTRDMKPVEALASNPLLWPVAVVAWPFKKLSESTSGSAQHSRSGGPQMPTNFPAPVSAEEADRRSDREQTLAMERALENQQRGATHPAPRGAPPTPQHATSSRSPGYATAVPRDPGGAARPSRSIAEELEALRRGTTAATEPISTPRRAANRMSARGASGDTAAHADPRRQQFDDNGDGRPDREEVFDADGLIAESAEDANRDGEIDTWTRYRNGAPVRRRADVDGDGLIDAWTYYADGGLEVARLERDTNGDGYRDQIDFFDAGQLARRMEDPNGDGLPERITRFDGEGRPAQRDEDSDGDGAMDTRSFYESGRLVRRHLLNEDERWEP